MADREEPNGAVVKDLAVKEAAVKVVARELAGNKVLPRRPARRRVSKWRRQNLQRARTGKAAGIAEATNRVPLPTAMQRLRLAARKAVARAHKAHREARAHRVDKVVVAMVPECAYGSLRRLVPTRWVSPSSRRTWRRCST